MGSRAFGADAQRAARVDTHERPAARTYRVQVDRRQPDRQAGDRPLRNAGRAAARQEANVGRRAAHVERDRVLEPGAPSDETGADDAGSRAGHEDRRRMRRSLADRRHAAR